MKVLKFTYGLKNNVVSERETASNPSKADASFKIFLKEIAFDETIDQNKFSATLENGVLIVTAPEIPPKEANDAKKKGRTIPIM